MRRHLRRLLQRNRKSWFRARKTHCIQRPVALVNSQANADADALPAWWNGRHKRLKISGPEGRAGSSPAAGTTADMFRPDNAVPGSNAKAFGRRLKSNVDVSVEAYTFQIRQVTV